MTSSVPPEILDELRAALGEAQVEVGEAVAARDPGWHPDNLRAGIVVSPSTTAEVAATVRIASRYGVCLVPQGGRTGLVGGGISQAGEIVLSTARLCRIESLDAVERVAVVGAGVTLEALQVAAAEHRLEPGIDLPSRGSATIGGMVSTNAGGVMAFRNGVMRHRVLGLEAVLPDGTIYGDLTRVVKASAGYDLKHLFIGAEGTLGIVTRVALRLDPLPRATATALFGLPSVAAVLDVIRMALDRPVGTLRAAEALWQSFFHLTSTAHGFEDEGLDPAMPVYLLLSLGGAEDMALQETFELLFEAAFVRHPDMTGVIATSARQERDLWRLREDTDAVYRAYPAAASYDVSVPLSAIEAYVPRVLAGLRAVDADFAPLVFGHLADGNLHIILNRAGPLPDDVAAVVEAVLYGGLTEAGGSFSAEHGIGSKRIHALRAHANPVKLALMAAVKGMVDRDGILNPGKVMTAEPAASRARVNRPHRSDIDPADDSSGHLQRGYVMPTDLPPDYKPKPAHDPNNPVDPNVPGSAPAYPPTQGEDARDEPGGEPQPGADVVDPSGWTTPPAPGRDPEPLPAGMPTF